MTLERDTFLDSLKTILIFLVVFGHCLVRLGGDNALINTAFQVVYWFHMPLFVIISGYLFRPEKSFKESCLGLFSSFVLFEFIWIIIDHPHSFRG